MSNLIIFCHQPIVTASSPASQAQQSLAKLSYLVSLLSIITHQTMQTTEETRVSIGQALRGASPQGSVLVTILLSTLSMKTLE